MAGMDHVAPVVKEIVVNAGTPTAFRVFTREVATWWPLETHALHPGAVREVVWEERVGGEVYEIATDGTRAHWATVTEWEPPTRLAIAWRVNQELPATHMEVTFTPSEGGTLVRVVHTGWERLGDVAAELRASYEGGWVLVLGRFQGALSD